MNSTPSYLFHLILSFLLSSFIILFNHFAPFTAWPLFHIARLRSNTAFYFRHAVAQPYAASLYFCTAFYCSFVLCCCAQPIVVLSSQNDSCCRYTAWFPSRSPSHRYCSVDVYRFATCVVSPHSDLFVNSSAFRSNWSTAPLPSLCALHPLLALLA